MSAEDLASPAALSEERVNALKLFSKLAVKDERSGYKVHFADTPMNRISKLASPVAALSEWSRKSFSKPTYTKKSLMLPSLEDLETIKHITVNKTLEQQDCNLKRKYIRELIDFQVQLMLKDKQSAEQEANKKVKASSKKSYNISVKGRLVVTNQKRSFK